VALTNTTLMHPSETLPVTRLVMYGMSHVQPVLLGTLTLAEGSNRQEQVSQAEGRIRCLRTECLARFYIGRLLSSLSRTFWLVPRFA